MVLATQNPIDMEGTYPLPEAQRDRFTARISMGYPDRMAEIATSGKPFVLVIAAEGSRAKAEYWKSGFYRLAQQTGLPILKGFVDGPTKTAGIGPTLIPSGDVRADMDKIRAFYADKFGFYPEKKTEPRLREELEPQD